tara:strand:+ start:16744 stop:18774 length:2031 start_codon:yes stop_codon:yes gene_type:complete
MAIKDFKEILQKEAKRIDIKDRKIFERGRMPAFFGRGVTDTIEFILYDNGDNQLPQGENGKMVRYINISEIDNIRNYLLIARGATSNKAPEFFVDVEKLINEAGYKNGLFRTQITLLNKRVGSEHFQNKVWIHEISPSRTEVRVLPLKTEDKILQKDLRDRYKILLENGEFRDDVLNRLDGFIDAIDANVVLRRIRALYGQDWINNVKKEFRIEDFDGFINDVTIKAKQAIGYFISNRGYKFGSAGYGKPMLDELTSGPGDRKRRNRRGRRRKPNTQRLDIATLQKKSMEIICDSIRFNLPKRNLQIQNTPTITKLESRDKINTILQTFGTSKKVDTKVTRNVKVVKPLKVVKASVTTQPVKPIEEPADPKPIKVTTPPKKYYFYHVFYKTRGFGGFGRRGKTTVIKYKDMNGDVNSFTLPMGRKIPKICAEEGSVKASPSKGVIIRKTELCEIITPLPKFVEPKPKPRPDLTKEQKDIIKNIKIPFPIKLDTPIKFAIDEDEIKKNIKKSFGNLNFPKIKFPKYIGAPGATGDAGGARGYRLPFGPGGITPKVGFGGFPTIKTNPFSPKPPSKPKSSPPPRPKRKGRSSIFTKPKSTPVVQTPPTDILKNLSNPRISFAQRKRKVFGRSRMTQGSGRARVPFSGGRPTTPTPSPFSRSPLGGRGGRRRSGRRYGG